MEKRVAEKRRRRRHSAEFKADAVEKMKNCDNIVALSQELKVAWRLLYRWKASSEERRLGEEQKASKERETALLEENVKLKVALADKTLEVDFFKGALRNIEALRQKRTDNGGEAFTSKSGK